MRFVSMVLTVLVFKISWAADLGIQGRCHDGTEFEFSLKKGSCHTQIGTFYLVERAFDFCKQHCSPVSGKCAVNEMNNIFVENCSESLQAMSKGFTATCGDGESFDFNTCSVPDDFSNLADRMCSAHQGVTNITIKDRCN